MEAALNLLVSTHNQGLLQVVNRFKMGTDCLTYSLSGMGCSSSICCVDLAKHMMANMPPTLCLIVSSENITTQAYPGSDKSMQIVNCIFRVGGAATLLSTRQASPLWPFAVDVKL